MEMHHLGADAFHNRLDLLTVIEMGFSAAQAFLTKNTKISTTSLQRVLSSSVEIGGLVAGNVHSLKIALCIITTQRSSTVPLQIHILVVM